MHNEIRTEIIMVMNEAVSRIQNILGGKVNVTWMPANTNIDDLKKIICSVCNVEWNALIKQDRRKHLATARHLFFWFGYKVYHQSHERLAKQLERDHTTSVNSVHVIEDHIYTNDEMIMPLFNAIKTHINTKNKEEQVPVGTSFSVIEKQTA